MAGTMDENEIKGVAEAMNELREKGQLSADTLAKLGGNSASASKALEGYTKSLLGAAGAVGGMAKSVAQGEGTFSSLGSTIAGVTSVIGKLASAIPLVGGAAKALAEGVGEAAKFVLDQLDVMAKNYQTLGDASAGAADGVDGLLRQFNQLGNYSLPAFTKAVKANALGLSALGGTAALGAEELSKVSGVLTTGDTARKFLKLGMSLDGVGDAAASFISNSSRLGLLQGDTTEELTKKTQNYILEVDKIARMTGQTREQQQQEAQKTLINTRFRAKLADMAANGQADAAEQLRLTAEGLGGAAGEAFRASATGIPATKAAAKANILYGDQIRQNVEAIKGGKQAQDAINDVMVAGAAGAERFNKTMQFGGDVFEGASNQALDYQQQVNANLKKGMTPAQAAATAQKKQAEAAGKTTEKFTNAQLAVANSSKQLQSLGFSLADAAIPAVNSFAEALDGVTGFISKKYGIGGTSVRKPGVDRGDAGGAQAIANGKARGSSNSAEDAMKFFQSAGWTKEQAAGIVGNLQVESGKNLNTGAVGDGGKAKGVAQWHPDRQAKFKDIIGKDVMSSTLEEQLKFVDWELKNTEKSAGDKLKQARTAAEAARIVDKQYERSSGAALGDRMASANTLAGPINRYPDSMKGVNPASAGADTQAQSNAHSASTRHSPESGLSKKLDDLNALMRQNNQQNAKILQQAKAG